MTPSTVHPRDLANALRRLFARSTTERLMVGGLEELGRYGRGNGLRPIVDELRGLTPMSPRAEQIAEVLAEVGLSRRQAAALLAGGRHLIF